MYINGKELAEWLVQKYGIRTGAECAMVFDILEHMGQMEKVEIGGGSGE